MKDGIRYLMFLLLGLISTNGFSQTDEGSPIKDDYLSFQTGFIVDGYNSLGVRTFFEYQKDLKNNWQFVISYEHSRHIGFFYFESSPLIVLMPFNRIYYSPMNIDHFDNFYTFTFFPFGIKVKL